ncbi:MAG: HD domain-containing protein [Candidatus Omnitrophica bacterium]|nr:HD domain-containing protein [Candidatus Omnitrophota bacterium]
MIDYKKALESAAKTMILVHEPTTLIKMIVRMMVQKVKVTHAGILLYNKSNNSYILTVSRGPLGLKIPVGFARMGPDNPLIQFFRWRRDKMFFGTGALVYDEAKKILDKDINADLKQNLNQTLHQIEIFEAVACIPSYFRTELLGILLLGKKCDGKKFHNDEIDFFIALASDVAMAIRNAQLFKELEGELVKKQRLFIHTTVALATAIDAKDHYTHGHTARVTTLSLELARKLFQNDKNSINKEFLEQLHVAALLHDIGKIGISETILNKGGALTNDERKKIEEHPLIGATILQPIKELGDSILGVKYHHEKYDGSGYPEGLKGERIPLIAAIIAVADAFDAMTIDRPYRHSMFKAEAVEEIKRVSGTQFNPLICNALVELYQDGKL